MCNRIDKYVGTIVTISAIALLESTAITYRMSTTMAVFAMLIIFSIFKGGVSSGISTTVISISYMFFLKQTRITNISYCSLSYYEFTLIILCMVAIGVLAAIMDYKYKSYYEKYKETDEYLTRAKEISEIMICHSNIDGKFIKVPPKLCSLLGYTQEELLGMSCHDVIHAEDIHKEEKLMESIIKGDAETYNIEKRLYKKNGETVCVFSSVSAVKDNDGEVICLLRYILDITERKRAEELKIAAEENKRLLAEAKEYERLRSEFFANVSHELRTPLNVILGTIQLLSMHKTDNRTNKYHSIMKNNCYRLLRLVNNLIDMTKIDAGDFHIDMKCHDIVRIVKDVALSSEDYIREKGLSLEFNTDAEEKIISCDKAQIERVILNLISNSVKFTKPGGKIRVSISCNDNRVIIRVRDTGIGIPIDKQEGIFGHFRQVDKSFTREREGSGIGLSLVKSLIELHGGTISLISRPDYGSLFIIELPVGEDTIRCEENEAAYENDYIDRVEIEFSDIYS